MFTGQGDKEEEMMIGAQLSNLARSQQKLESKGLTPVFSYRAEVKVALIAQVTGLDDEQIIRQSFGGIRGMRSEWGKKLIKQLNNSCLAPAPLMRKCAKRVLTPPTFEADLGEHP